MTEVSRISDAELNNIEFENADLFLEEVNINGIQLKAIIHRLREAERGLEIVMPFMTRAADRQKIQELNMKWGWARFLALVAGLVAGLSGVSIIFYILQPVDAWVIDARIWVFISTVSIGFMLPFCAVSLPLLKQIDKIVAKAMEPRRG